MCGTRIKNGKTIEKRIEIGVTRKRTLSVEYKEELTLSSEMEERERALTEGGGPSEKDGSVEKKMTGSKSWHGNKMAIVVVFLYVDNRGVGWENFQYCWIR